MAIRYAKTIQSVPRKMDLGREREVDNIFFSPPISDALEFLMGLYAQGLGYSTLKTAHSAWSSILRISDCQNFGPHPLVV